MWGRVTNLRPKSIWNYLENNQKKILKTPAYKRRLLFKKNISHFENNELKESFDSKCHKQYVYQFHTFAVQINHVNRYIGEICAVLKFLKLIGF